jgi:glucosamine-phosphate N-acetyltransferase
MNYIIRQLIKNDYLEYIELINKFRPIGIDITLEKYEEIYNEIFKNSIIFVIEYNNKLIATAKLIIEQKFIHKLAKYGYIEDVIVDENYRKQNIGKDIIKYIVDYCKNNNFFKITLSCNKSLINFYEKNNFEVYDIHMSQLL